MMNPKHALRIAPLYLIALATATLVIGAPGATAADPPNVLIIMADDCTYNDLPLYGGPNAKTPHLDKLAAQGLTFNKAYLSEAMCQPCRAELYSGLYPMSNGCAWNHSNSKPETKSLPHHLGALGYRVGLSGKVHVGPRQAFPFEEVGGFDKSCVRSPTQAHELNDARSFMTRDRDQPFALVIALVEPHVPWVMGDASRYPPNKVKLPANFADTPRTRSDFSKYLAEITYMDGQIGEILAMLDEEGLADDTLVMFTSEQGSQFPGCKWTNWDTGLHTALIARWPGKIAAGKRTDALVQYADVAPTLVELAGGSTRGKGFDGTSFAGVLTSKTDTHRDYVYGVHNNIPEGPAYPIRTISDGEYRYIRNLKPEAIYVEKHLMGSRGSGALNNPYWGEWIFNMWEDKRTHFLATRYMQRPPVQFYHTSEDPYELKNLAKNPAQKERVARMSAELDRWLRSQGDPGLAQDTHEAHQAAKQLNHLFGPPKVNE
ncbi:MAG: sulfatase family protein [Planctomycetota bacterium]|jgi:uncharacterized sulfatase